LQNKAAYKKVKLIFLLDEKGKNAVYRSIYDIRIKNKFQIFFEQYFPINMRHITIYTTDKEYSHFVELAKNLHYVKKIETDDEPFKGDILHNIKEGLAEVRLYQKGKLKTTSAKDFLSEL
jgi:hypothetical protein